MNGNFVLYPFSRPPLPFEKVKITSALANSFGLELAEDVISQENIPPYDVATRDGWAIATEDKHYPLKSPAIVNGEGPKYLEVNSYCWINTGGYLPERADAVVSNKEPSDPEFGLDTYPLENVLPKGSEWQRGELILKAGTVLAAAQQALLFEAGIQEVIVYKRPSVAILATGHEIVEAGSESIVKRGRHSSNATYLSNLLNGLGLTDTAVFFAKDSAVELSSRLISLGQYFDFIITVGGTGQGKSDLLRKSIKMSGGSLIKDGTRLSSSLPFVYGKMNKSILIGLPGNPLGFICLAQRFVLPQIWSSFMTAPFPVKKVEAIMGFNFQGKAGDICVQLAPLGDHLIALPLQKGSGRSASFRDAQAIIKNPKGHHLEANQQVEAELFFNGLHF